MGARGQIKIVERMADKERAVYLYTHWGVGNMEMDVYRAMMHTNQDSTFKEPTRTTDPEYFSRVIFDRMKEDDTQGTLSYGIGNFEHGDIEKLITIDPENKEITIKTYDWDSPDKEITYTYEEFVTHMDKQFRDVKTN